ncbi:2366_t:CDS:1, partial [Dentiscutata erythropus]
NNKCLAEIAAKSENDIEILTAKVKNMNTRLEALKKEPALDSITELAYMDQISLKMEQFDKLKNYKKLEEKLEELIKENYNLQIELFALKTQSLNNMFNLEKIKKKVKNDLQLNENINETRKSNVNKFTRNFEKDFNKFTKNFENQVNNDQIKKINYQEIVEKRSKHKMKEINNYLKIQENTLKNKFDNNKLMIESSFYIKTPNDLDNIIYNSEKKVKELNDEENSIRDELEKTIKHTEKLRHNKDSDYKSQILKLDTQIEYLKEYLKNNNDYKKLKKF